MPVSYENPVTLEEVRKNLRDDFEIGLINEFQENGYFARNLTFHPCVTPVGAGATLTYGYTRLMDTAEAEFRYINEDWTNTFVHREAETVTLKVLGRSFVIDEVLAQTGGIVDEVTLQMTSLIRAVTGLFDECCLLGDSRANPKEFDGLFKFAERYQRIQRLNENNEIYNSQVIQQNARDFLIMLDDWLATFDSAPSFIGGNYIAINRLKALAKEVGKYTLTQDQWGRHVEMYSGIPLVDFGYRHVQKINPDYSFKREMMIPVDIETGATKLIAGRFGMDAIHGVSLRGQAPYTVKMPNPSLPGVLHQGSVSMVSAIVCKKINSIGVLDNLVVQRPKQPSEIQKNEKKKIEK